MLIQARDAGNAPQTIKIADTYDSPNGKNIRTATTLDSLFSDDFGGVAIDASKWDVLDGGLGANPNLGYGALTQVAIGSGIGMGAGTVSGSGLAVAMGTTANAELWYLSKQVFAGKEDILVILSKSQALAANSVFVGIVEVDPTTNVPLLNPNLAGDFTNRGGVEFGASATATAYHAEAIGDSSGTVASSAIGVATAWTTAQECLIEIDSRDVTAQTALVDSVASKAGGVRVSTQCPNDTKRYKLLIRFRNPSAPGSGTTVTIQRILVVDNYEQRVQVSTGEGDAAGSKALLTAITGFPADNGLVSGNPLPVSGIARSANRTAATTGRVVSPTFDLAGNVVTKLGGIAPAQIYSGKVALANTTETSLIAAGGATVRNKVDTICFANLDTVKHIFDVRDSTAGTIRYVVCVPPGDSRVLNIPSEACAAALNTAWTVQMREAITTTNPEVTASGYATTA